MTGTSLGCVDAGEPGKRMIHCGYFMYLGRKVSIRLARGRPVTRGEGRDLTQMRGHGSLQPTGQIVNKHLSRNVHEMLQFLSCSRTLTGASEINFPWPEEADGHSGHDDDQDDH